LESLYDHPIVTVKHVSEQLGMTFSTANELVKHLSAIGLLRPLSEQRRNRQFSYQEYLDLFSDTEVQAPAVE
jgi:ribosomal protein S25